ncbi:Smr/MutS family protein [Paracoccus denitrificans]|jgi:DNA-nicking Smr family endonuclease|uniref:Smr protein/MutS2 n=1 Tax=Paracoccus denitrificans (strain Pd 1222) TaxID=318586 RepID=A1B5S7_PARDP|nr:Smr/MutS family protein [Paracoccus denitrificans]ABL70871.1 Smr protein/MutS2 [Paracoccus denitrificans PD1222]MBB4627671.1 DNA-nicking Smr family endonuclease [Paracoccus denitrificans]MCU7428977.1 Smr/MutS family protein [Paracoccus denitrificans]QAR26190.1 DNA mismatch repair protein MutS [Paracoccus denitrificans]UPV95106.1 Smr/MutS family protein [Paracoccus denitrificans]
MARRRGLSAEDKALWSRVAATAVPLHPARKQAEPAPEPRPLKKPPAMPPAMPQVAPLPLAGLRIGGKPGAGTTRLDLSPAPREALHAQPLRMDHKTHRQMSRGKLAPEARIDLHGMTLAVAQPVLTRFILQARAEGRRLVLVITGKGREGGPDAPLPVRPGALRHNVPHWLHMPPLNAMVLQVRPAHRRHGGEGAYYVYLRR